MRASRNIHDASRKIAVTVVLFAIGTVAVADGAEPREETEFGSNPGNLRMFSYVPGASHPLR